MKKVANRWLRLAELNKLYRGNAMFFVIRSGEAYEEIAATLPARLTSDCYFIREPDERMSDVEPRTAGHIRIKGDGRVEDNADRADCKE